MNKSISAILYPLQLTSILTIAIFSLLVYFLANITSMAGGSLSLSSVLDPAHLGSVVSLALIPAWLTTLGLFLNYAFMVLGKSSEGICSAPIISVKDGSYLSNPLLFQFLALVAMVYIVSLKLDSLIGVSPFILLLVFSLTFMPAIIINLIKLNSFILAINPINIINVIRCLRFYYLVIALIFSFCLSSAYIIMLNASQSLVLIICMAYLLIFSFHCLGLIMYSNSDVLGIEILNPVRTGEQIIAEEDDLVVRELTTELYKFCKARRFAVAAKHLEETLEKNGWHLDKRIHNELKNTYYTDLFFTHAKQYVHRLILKNRLFDAWEICSCCYDKDETFFLDDGEDLLALTQLAHDLTQTERLRSMISRFADEKPDHFLTSRLKGYLSL